MIVNLVPFRATPIVTSDSERGTVPQPVGAPDGGASDGQADSPPRRGSPRRWARRMAPAAVIARAVGAVDTSSPTQVLASLLGRRRPVAAQMRPTAAANDDIAAGPTPQAVQRAAGDRAAFWQIWLAHRGFLHRQSLRFSAGNLAEAEDAMSDAMMKAAEAFSASAIREHRAWLLRLVHNACMDRHRSRHRHAGLIDLVHDGASAPPDLVPARCRSPEDHLSGCELIVHLQRAIAALPRSLAEPLLLYLDDFSDAEIAAHLGTTLDVVRKRRQLARDRLRRHLPP
jgi:RNA polymerase sigma factor (sigma-70 family)